MKPQFQGLFWQVTGMKERSEAGFSTLTATSLYVEIPDAGFEKFLIAQRIDDVLDGKLLKVNAEKVKFLDINLSCICKTIKKVVHFDSKKSYI